jgi:putative ABC transport system permease protein
MLRHYFTIAVRILERQKLSAFINVLGLSIGLACFSLFLLYGVNEFSYDRFHTNQNSIYRVYDWWKYTERQGAEPSSSTPLGPALKSDIADVEEFVRVMGGGEHIVRVDGRLLSAKLTFADPQILSVFTFPLLEGDASNALSDPNNIVVTKSVATKLFGDVDPIGKQLEIREGNEFRPFVVTAVTEDVPVNSSIRFEMLGSFERVLNTPMGMASSNSWTMTIGINVFVKLREGSRLPNEPERIASFRAKYFPTEASELKKNGEWDGTGALPTGYGLQPLTSMHTDVSVDQGASNPRNIWTLIGIAGGVLIIACINFIVMSIGRSAGRSKEVGVRKISGSRRKQLIFQFLSESLLLTSFSALLGIGIAQVLLPLFNELSGRSLTFSIAQYPEMVTLMLGTIITVGLMSGSYPALVLSGFEPIKALKNKIRLSGSNFFTRSLVTFQFVLSVTIIIVTVVFLQQLSFMRSRDLGLQKDQVVMIWSQSTKSYEQFKQLIESQSVVAGVTGSEMGLGAGAGQMGSGYNLAGKRQGVIEYPVDEKFLDVMGVKLIAGRNFRAGLTSDTVTSIIVNESLVKSGLNTTPEKAIGMQIASARDLSVRKTIIGVVRDFNFESLTREVRPQLFSRPATFNPSAYFVHVKKVDTETLSMLESAWKKVAPDLPFKYSFVDESFNAFYKEEQRWATILGLAGNICIVLASLGLFGLASLSAANRTKEVGIRKVLGASVTGIARLLSGDFVKLVFIAIVISTPIAWYITTQWLTKFAYRIELSWLTFVMTGVFALIVAVFTVGIQAVRAAVANPVKSLRSE